MFYRRNFLAVLLFAAIAFGCKKGSSVQTCEDLQEGMITNNAEQVKTIITGTINRLPSDIYNQQNLATLSSYLSDQCSISSDVICFDCIKTLPGESEIRLSFTLGGLFVARTIDISYSPDNKMKVVNMHE